MKTHIRELISKLYQYRLLLCVLAIWLYYISPIIANNDYLVGNPGDTYWYLWQTNWFCKNFYTYNLKTTDFFAPHGVDLSGGYSLPLINTVACLLPSTPLSLRLNYIVILQLLLIVLFSFVVATKYIKNFHLQLSFILLYVFSGFFQLRVGGHVDLLSTIWSIPLVYYAIDSINFLSKKSIAFNSIVFAVVMGSSWQNLANLTFLSMGLLFWNLIDQRKSVINNYRLFIQNIILGLLIFFITFLPLSYPIIIYNLQTKTRINIDENTYYNLDLAGLLLPINSNNLFLDKKMTLWESRKSLIESRNPIDILVASSFLILVIFLSSRFIGKEKFILILSLIYLFLSLGSELTIFGKHILGLEYYNWISSFLPLSSTRAPGRLAIVSVFFITLITIKKIDEILYQKKRFSLIPMLFSVYVIYTTLLNQLLLKIPHHKYLVGMPQMAMIQVSNAKNGGIVLPIPNGVGIDPNQDLIQLLVKKPLISGYVNSHTQTRESTEFIKRNPLLLNLNCNIDIILNDQYVDFSDSAVKDQIFDNNIKYIFLNKSFPECKNVGEKIAQLQLKNAWNLIESTNKYDVFMINDDYYKNTNTLSGYALVSVGEGWGPRWDNNSSRWIKGLNATLSIFASRDGDWQFSGDLIELTNEKPKTVKISVNNQLIILNTSKEKTFSNKIHLNKGNNLLEIIVDACDRPIDLKINEDKSCYSVGMKNISVHEAD